MLKIKEISLADDEELKQWIDTPGQEITEALAVAADRVRREHYGDEVYVRGLIEFTNYCKNNCYYCGIRRDNSNADRYRLTKEEILSCCEEGYRLGFRTFVLQGGEDPYFTDDRVCDIVSEFIGVLRIVRSRFPSEKNQEKVIRPIMMPGQNAICCAMRQRRKRIMGNCIRQR